MFSVKFLQYKWIVSESHGLSMNLLDITCGNMMSVICDVIRNGLLTIVTLAVLLMSPTVVGRKEHRYITPAPVFNPTESNYTYHKGERAILYCSVKNLGTKTVIWRRVNESIPLTIGELTLIDDDRYEVAHIEESPDWNLMISNVTTHETGSYECQVSAVDRELRKKVYLTVRDEYSYAEPQISISGKLHVDRGMELRLLCNATGALTPPDSIDWFKDGSKITADNFKRIELRKRLSINSRTITSILSKAHAEMNDAATYTCRTSDLQVKSVKVNVLNTDKKSRKREPLAAGENSNMSLPDESSRATGLYLFSWLLLLISMSVSLKNVFNVIR